MFYQPKRDGTASWHFFPDKLHCLTVFVLSWNSSERAGTAFWFLFLSRESTCYSFYPTFVYFRMESSKKLLNYETAVLGCNRIQFFRNWSRLGRQDHSIFLFFVLQCTHRSKYISCRTGLNGRLSKLTIISWRYIGQDCIVLFPISPVDST